MSVRVNIFYSQLREIVGDDDPVTVNGSTVGECLDDFIGKYPGAEKLLFDERGQMLRQVFVFVNAESVNKTPMEQPVRDGDVLIIAIMITAG